MYDLKVNPTHRDPNDGELRHRAVFHALMAAWYAQLTVPPSRSQVVEAELHAGEMSRECCYTHLAGTEVR